MKPNWIRTKWPEPEVFNRVAGVLDKHNLNTVCRSARCPNIGECFSHSHMTFMILGDVCARKCAFCSVKKGGALPPDPREADNIVKVVELLGLNYVIVTSVTRDDLPDGGGGTFAGVINALKNRYPDIKVEILTPDFFGEVPYEIIDAMPYIWAHNVETVPRLYSKIRPQADYKRSLNLLSSIKVKANDILTKSGIMLGLGEGKNEVVEVLNDLKYAGVDIVTIGQYLKPGKENVDVAKFLTPSEFERYKDEALKLGFKSVLSAPLVRSSYRLMTNDKVNKF